MPAEKTAYQKLTVMQRRFVDAYLGEARGNASKAARLAGYSCPYQVGHEVRHTPSVSAVIEERLAQHALSANEVLSQLADVARGSVEDFITVGGSDLGEDAEQLLQKLIEDCDTALAEIREDGALPPGVPEQIEVRREELRQTAEQLRELTRRKPWVFDLAKAEREGKLHLIEELAQTEHGTRLKLASRADALKLLAQVHGLLRERHEVEVRDAGAAQSLDRKLDSLAASLGAASVPSQPDGEGEAGA